MKKQQSDDGKGKIGRKKEGKKLTKYGYGYFEKDKFDKSKMTEEMKKCFKEYPRWYLSHAQLCQKQFKRVFETLVQAHPLSLDLRELQTFKYGVLNSVQTIRFMCLKQLELNLRVSCSIEGLAWLECPLLEKLVIVSKAQLSSIKPLGKCYWRNLKIVCLIDGQNSFFSGKRLSLSHDVGILSRTKFFSKEKSQLKAGTKSKCSINLISPSRRDIAIWSKLELRQIKDFKFDYMNWSRLNVRGELECLKRKFMNKILNEDSSQNYVCRYPSSCRHFSSDDEYDVELDGCGQDEPNRDFCSLY